MNSHIDTDYEDLRIPGSLPLARKLLPQTENLQEIDTFKLTEQIIANAKKSKNNINSDNFLNADMSIEKIEQEIKNLIEEGNLEEFILRYAESLFLSGQGKPKGINDETYAFLRKIGKSVIEVSAFKPAQVAPLSSDKLLMLRDLDRSIVEFATTKEFIKAADYVYLNAQHKVIATWIKEEEARFIDSLHPRTTKVIEENGLLNDADLSRLSELQQQEIRHLIQLGILHKVQLDDQTYSIAYAGAKLTSHQFEAAIKPRLREKIGEQLWLEFKTKYSGRFRPIGISENRHGGVPTILDRARVKTVADKAGVSVSHVVLTLKYLEQFGSLVQTNHSGYSLGLLADDAGLGVRAIRFMERMGERNTHSQSTENPSSEITLQDYIAAAKLLRHSFKVPEYTLETSTGGLPPTFFIDEVLLGNARIDTDLLANLVTRIQSTEGAFVIAANMLQGDPAAEPKSMRTSIPPGLTKGVDLREYRNQLPFLKSLIKEMNKASIVLQGKNEHLTAQIRADVQREKFLSDAPLDDAEVDLKLAGDNPVTERARRKYNAKLQSELHDFISNVVHPFEVKLGRQLMETAEVYKRTGLRLNEIEIIRDMVDLLLADARTGGSQGREKIISTYQDLLDQPDIGANYLFRLEQVLFPEHERLAPGELVARGGAYINFTRPDKTHGLRLLLKPEARLGIGEVLHPTEKIVSILKSAAAGGESLPDVVMVGSSGETFLSMMANGTLIVSAASMQASDFDNNYFFGEASDRHKRRLFSKGGQNYAGAFSISGGIDKGVKTNAFQVTLMNHKVEKVLEENRLLNKPSNYVDIYATSDWQTGSPTHKPETWFRGLIWAILNGQKEIVINGDVLQGQNYGRAVAEMQLTGLVGIEDQQAFVGELMNSILDMIFEFKVLDPSWEIPTFRIIAGNHETNSQSNKGGQGIWFLLPLATQIQSFYRGAFGKDVADEKVQYPRKFIDHNGTNVDYSHLVIDATERTGFRIAAQHYVGIGGKGSSSVTPAAAMAKWARSMESTVGDIHGCLWAHFHTQSVVQRDGIFHVIFGANAGGSGFEHHLGYPTTVPASGRLRLYSDRPPELLFLTEPYLKLAEDEFNQSGVYNSLMAQFGSIENYVEATRRSVQMRERGSYSYHRENHATV